MRVIGGILKGRRLQTYQGIVVRPTADKVREAVFDILAPCSLDGWMLDLFAGTGSVGIEALSRGMERAVFVENNHRVLAILRKNICVCGLKERAKVVDRSVSTGLKILGARDEKFQLIFLDPSYGRGLVGHTLLGISEAGLLSRDGIVVAEHSSGETVESSYGSLVRDDCRRYGQTLISLFHLL
ncbi:MAG: 16S rRNA (guanine(966)-N(2))-methyltransferase RsmD [Deltaproteobacteria bacterium]|nr:16S rRNA (guanine(966)-N(2))-methyltransferase RsmD [Deltaproteobacteria bacterium]